MFIAGLALGGIATSGVLVVFAGLAEPVPFGARQYLGLLVAGTSVVHALGVFRLRLPENRRQIPSSVLRRGLRGFAQFGFELGTGARTFLPSPLPIALALMILLGLTSLSDALVLGFAFGLGRSVVVIGAYRAKPNWDVDFSLHAQTMARIAAIVFFLGFAAWVVRV